MHCNRIEAAITNYELAFRMQSAVPELMDLRGETEATKKLYGLDDAYAPTLPKIETIIAISPQRGMRPAPAGGQNAHYSLPPECGPWGA